MWRDDLVRQETRYEMVNPDEPGARALAFKWVQGYIQEHRKSILSLEEDEAACPFHVAAYWRSGHLWLMGRIFLDWVHHHQNVHLPPKIMMLYIDKIGANLGYQMVPGTPRVPVIRLPRGGQYSFTPRAIILRGAVDDRFTQPSSN